MKAIVAKVLFGGIFGCLGWTNSATASPKVINKSELETPMPSIISAKLLSNDKLLVAPQFLNFVDHIVTVNKSENFDLAVDYDESVLLPNGFGFNLNSKDNQGLSLGKLPYAHRNNQGNLILGFQNTFWKNENKRKYWGLTAIEHWGNDDKQKLNLPKLKRNYIDSAPILASGSSALTVSGGGNNNLAKKGISPREFAQFRGGVAYHRGLADHVTMGVGFAYEDLLLGFTQLTYQNDRFPLRTTVSLLTEESGLNLHSHVSFEPAKNFVLNYYHDQEKQKFDFNWGVTPGLNLIAQGNSKDQSLSTGIKVAANNDYLSFSAKATFDSKPQDESLNTGIKVSLNYELLSLSAKATLDNNRNLQWKLNSQIGPFQFAYNHKQQKTTSELDLNLLDSDTLGIQCSAFFKYKSKGVKQNQEQFTVWGGKLHSNEKIGQNKHRWTLDLGYGSGSLGQGAIASGAVALKPNLSLKLSYQEISAVSDDTKIKLQLGSK